MEVATKDSESRLGARSGVANESRKCGRERELRERSREMGVVKWGREREARKGVAKIKNRGAYVNGIPKGVII